MKKERSLAAKLTLRLAVPVLAVTACLCFQLLSRVTLRSDTEPFYVPVESGIAYQPGAEMDRMLYDQLPLYGDHDILHTRIAVNDSGEIVFRDRLGFSVTGRTQIGLSENYRYRETLRFVVVDELFEWSDIMEIADFSSFPEELHVTGYDDGFYFYATSLEVKAVGRPARSWEAPAAPGPDSLSLYTDDTAMIRLEFPNYVIHTSSEHPYSSAEEARKVLANTINTDSVRWARLIAILDSISDEPVTSREFAFAREDSANAFSPYLWQEITTETVYPNLFTNTGLHIYSRVYETPLPYALGYYRKELFTLLFLVSVLLLGIYLLANHLISSPLHYAVMEVGHIVNAETWFSEKDLTRNDELGALTRELKKAEAAFREKWDTERTLERKRQDFVAAASHDLKTPLALIGGYVEAVQQNIDPAENARYLDSIEREAGKMNRLVLEMLDYTRLDRMNELKNGRRENLAVLLGGWLDEAAPLFEKQTLERTLPERLFVRCDAVLLRRAVDNLLSNAAKFTPQGGTVRVSLDNRAGGIFAYLEGQWSFCLAVENEGDPIPEDDLERIFEMFYHTDRARTRGEAGNGVGLASAKRICELHGFSLHAENTRTGVRFLMKG